MKRRLEAALLFLALATPLALAGSEIVLAPTAAGTWRGILDPPGAGRIILAALTALAAVVSQRRRFEALRPLLVLLVSALPAIPLQTGRASLLLAFQGPMLFVIALGALGVTLQRLWSQASPRPASARLVFALAFVFYGALTFRLPGAAGPQGDEPHYLVIAESLRSDRDLDLRDEHDQRAYHAFYSGRLAPHRSPASPPGALYSIHAPGLPLFVLPGYAALGFRGAQLGVALLAALAIASVFGHVRRLTASESTARATAGALALAPPFSFYAVSLYPEMAAAFATAVFLSTARSDPTPRRLLFCGAVAGALPWFHPKFLPLAALGLALVVVRRGSRPARAAAVALFAAGVVGLLALFNALYGRASLSAAYGGGFASDVALRHLPVGLAGLLLDRQYGLLPLAPLFLLVVPGFALLSRRAPGDTMRATLLAGAVLGVAGSFSMWWGGSCPPARFVVPALPALALFLAVAARRTPALFAGLAGAGLAVTLVAAWAPRAIHNRPDGESALLKVLAPGVSLDPLLPSFVADGESVPAGVHERRAVLELLRGWDSRRIVSVAGRLRLEDLSLPVPLEPGPSALAVGDVRRSRRLEGPAGTYRLHVAVALPEGCALRVRLEDGGAVIAHALLQPGHTAFEPLVVLGGRHGRRLVFSATALSPGAVVSNLRLTPIELRPRR